MSKELARHNKNGAMALPDFLELLKSENLRAIEVSSADVTQCIKIEFNSVTGKIEWFTDNADGALVQHIMITALYDMFRYFIKASNRPKFNAGSAQILINLEPDRLQIAIDKDNDPHQLKTALMLALWEVIEMTNYDPIQDLKQIMTFSTKGE